MEKIKSEQNSYLLTEKIKSSQFAGKLKGATKQNKLNYY